MTKRAPTPALEPHRRDAPPQGSSDRGFGLVMAAFFAIVGLWPVPWSGQPRLWSLGVAAVFMGAALARPGALAPLNRLWTRFGLLLHRIVNPVVMGLVFYLTVTPIGLLMRALGKDPLRLRLDRTAATYWIEREPGPAPETMKNQF